MQAESLLANKEQRQETLLRSLSGELRVIEPLRIEFLRKKKQLNIWFFLIAIPISLIAIGIASQAVPVIIAVLVVIYLIIQYFYLDSIKNKIENLFEKKIIPGILHEFFPEAIFSVKSYISDSDYWNSGLFSHRLDSYDGNNYAHGTFGKTDVRFSKLHTQYKVRTKNSTTWHTVFEGIFMVANCNKRFKGRTIVLPDLGERIFGGLGRWMQQKNPFSRGEMVYLENPEFEKEFVVYSTDPVEARYLLTPSMQQYMLDLYHHIGREGLHVSFIDGNVYMGLSGSFKMFKIDHSLSFSKKSTIDYYSKDLIHILKAIEILDLNTRIWGN